MSPLRKQMEDDLVVRGMSPRTLESYTGAVAALAKHYGRSPDRISAQEVQRYLLYLIQEKQLAWSSCNIALSGLKFFYRVTLKRGEAQFELPTPRQRQKLPQILAPEEVVRIIELTIHPKHRALLMTTYAAGLRLSEVCHLKVSNIDSTRMTIHVEQAKVRGTVTRRCRRDCSRSCAVTGCCSARSCGCFRAVIPTAPSRRTRCRKSSSAPRRAPALHKRAVACTPCAIHRHSATPFQESFNSKRLPAVWDRWRAVGGPGERRRVAPGRSVARDRRGE